MLLSLLSGVRETRGPLIAGLIWGFSFLLVWVDSPLRDSNQVPEAAIQSLADYAGPGPTLAVAGFLCYLLGLLQPDPRRLHFPLPNIARDFLKSIWTKSTFGDLSNLRKTEKDHRQPRLTSTGDVDRLRRFLTERFEPLVADIKDETKIWEKLGMSPRTGEAEPGTTLVEDVLTNFEDDERALSSALRAKASDRVYQTYDQKSSEADLRRRIAVAATVLIGVLAVVGSGWWCCLLVVPIALEVQGEAKYRESLTELAQALSDQLIQSDRVERMIVRLQQTAREQNV